MTKSTRARYTLEFKEEAVRLVAGGERVATVARNFGLSEQTLHNWVKAADKGGLKSSAKDGAPQRDVRGSDVPLFLAPRLGPLRRRSSNKKEVGDIQRSDP
jgi:transposase-like protein